MKLEVQNFAKLKSAEIIIDGITVIAGENNTGKSTIGKVLFSLFNSFSDIETKIVKQRKIEIEEACRVILGEALTHMPSKDIKNRNAFPLSGTARRIARSISREIEDCDYDSVCIEEIITKQLQQTNSVQGEEREELVETLLKRIQSILDIPEDFIILEVLTRYFGRVFSQQMNSLTRDDSAAKLNMTIKGKNIRMTFFGNECVEYDTDISIMHKAIYIDNPFILDQFKSMECHSVMDEYLMDLLLEDSDDDIMKGIIESVMTKEMLEDIYESLHSVVEGRIVRKNENEFYLEKEGYARPIAFESLSTGLKSFVLIKMMLEKGILKNKDILILDEPEIHLHPQWQMTYAELIVLLQKHFDLTVVVTTHSPYFLDAINLFSVKYGIHNKTNYYLASVDGEQSSIDCVTGNIEQIYQKMVSPIQQLETLRYELNNM